MNTDFQFVLLSGPVEREARFQSLKARHGSLFAWHGSSPGNWHVILRTSLQNMSNTKHMYGRQPFRTHVFAPWFTSRILIAGHLTPLLGPPGLLTATASILQPRVLRVSVTAMPGDPGTEALRLSLSGELHCSAIESQHTHCQPFSPPPIFFFLP